MMSVYLYFQVHEHIKNHLHTLTHCTLIIHESSYNLIDENYTKCKMFVFSLSTHLRPMLCLLGFRNPWHSNTQQTSRDVENIYQSVL